MFFQDSCSCSDLKELKAIRLTLQELKEIRQDLGDLKTLKQEIQDILQQNRELKSQNAKLARRLEELEQYQRSNNIEVKGVPLEGEPTTIIKKIGHLVAEEVDERDIDICHRVPTARHDESNIIVRFVQRSKKNSLLAKARKMRLDTKMLGFDDSQPVYVNEHLTRVGKQLLGAAIKKKKEVKWKFVWTNGGKIFARQNETSPILRIFSVDDLDSMTT